MKPREILALHNLKRTSCREGIISTVLSAKYALSEDEIRENLAGNYDRTTFYRSFKTLEENKILHKIVVDSLLVKYALDNRLTKKKEHAHFYCKKCGTVKCLDAVVIENPQLPTGYSFEESEVIFKGLCLNCKETKN